jgi:hypothetical protein
VPGSVPGTQTNPLKRLTAKSYVSGVMPLKALE